MLAMALWHYRVLLVMVLPSHDGDGAAKAMLAVVGCHYQVILTMALPTTMLT
jgi:hypothetical protein